MKFKSIGILSGAGPLAGASLLERILTLSQEVYGCCRDADFPKIFLLSFPFSEMLLPGVENDSVCEELSVCLEQLRRNGAEINVVACNTLHAFIDVREDVSDLIHLPKITANAIPTDETPLVLCTSTAVKFGVHRRFFACRYPESTIQKKLDQIIDRILSGEEKLATLTELRALIESQDARVIVLGCTELSLFSKQLIFNNKLVIDPLDIAAYQLLERSFITNGLYRE